MKYSCLTFNNFFYQMTNLGICKLVFGVYEYNHLKRIQFTELINSKLSLFLESAICICY